MAIEVPSAWRRSMTSGRFYLPGVPTADPSGILNSVTNTPAYTEVDFTNNGVGTGTPTTGVLWEFPVPGNPTTGNFFTSNVYIDFTDMTNGVDGLIIGAGYGYTDYSVYFGPKYTKATDNWTLDMIRGNSAAWATTAKAGANNIKSHQGLWLTDIRGFACIRSNALDASKVSQAGHLANASVFPSLTAVMSFYVFLGIAAANTANTKPRFRLFVQQNRHGYFP